MQKALAALVAGACVGLAGAAAAGLRPEALETAEFWSYDARARYAAAREPAPSDVVLVDVGESDIENVARNLGESWPWPRALFGHLVSYFSEAGARAVILDFVFQDAREADDLMELADALRASGKAVFGVAMPATLDRARIEEGRWGAALGAFGDRDEGLEAAIALMSHGWNAYLVAEPAGGARLWIGGKQSAEEVQSVLEYLGKRPVLPGLDLAAARPVELGEAQLAGEASRLILRERHALPLEPTGLEISRRALVAPVPVLGARVARLGNILQEAETDGIFRRHQLVVEHDGLFFPSLALAGFLVANPEISPRLEPGALVLGDRRVPIDSEANLAVRFNRRDFTHVRAYDVLRSLAQISEGEAPVLPPRRFKDKYIVVAPSAYALLDVRSTPVSDIQPGAEINATVLGNLVAGRAVRRAAPVVDAAFAFLLALLATVAVAGLWGATRTLWGALVGAVAALAAAVGGAVVLCTWLLAAHDYWLALTVPGFGALTASLGSLLAASSLEQRDRRFVQEALGRYTSPLLVRELLSHPEYLSLEWGEVREISVFFSDIAGFTNFSEQLKPERLVALLNDYLTNMTEIVLEHGGVVDKYIGDAIMAFWGAPLPEPEHAKKAVLAALAMRRRCRELQGRWQAEFGPLVRVRAGINSGPAVSGNMGSRHKFNYTVMGDTVNLASRLEGANKPYGTDLMISESCWAHVRDCVEARELDLLAVKGKQEPVKVYEVLAEKGKAEPKALECARAFEKGLGLYREARFEEALRAFEGALAIAPDDGPSKTFVERCRHFLEQPPSADWDGVWRMKEK